MQSSTDPPIETILDQRIGFFYFSTRSRLPDRIAPGFRGGVFVVLLPEAEAKVCANREEK